MTLNLSPLPDFDAFWEQGFPAVSEEYVLFGDFRADPEKHKLKTPSGRIRSSRSARLSRQV